MWGIIKRNIRSIAGEIHLDFTRYLYCLSILFRLSTYDILGPMFVIL